MGLLRSLAVTVSVVALAAACSSGDEGTKKADPVVPAPAVSGLPQGVDPVAVPGSKQLTAAPNLKKPVTYPDNVKVAITDVRWVKNQEKGPGNIQGQVLALFTIRFDNGSAKPLDLNQTKITALYGARQVARPTYYGNLNDFFGEVKPGGTLSAAYAFAIPVKAYKKVALKVDFGSGHKPALWVGSLKV